MIKHCWKSLKILKMIKWLKLLKMIKNIGNGPAWREMMRNCEMSKHCETSETRWNLMKLDRTWWNIMDIMGIREHCWQSTNGSENVQDTWASRKSVGNTNRQRKHKHCKRSEPRWTTRKSTTEVTNSPPSTPIEIRARI